MTHNIIGNEVGRTAFGGPNTGSINGGRRRNRRWMFMLQGAGAACFLLIALGVIFSF